MTKTASLNSLLLHELAAAINREAVLPGAIITITYVDCSPDLKQAKVGFSVLPDNLSGTALQALKKASGRLVELARPRARLRRWPHLIWEFDATEKEALKIEKLIAGLD